jgi:hypothetical protein
MGTKVAMIDEVCELIKRKNRAEFWFSQLSIHHKKENCLLRYLVMLLL